MKLINFKPSRTKEIGNDNLVSDLDALVQTPVAFRVLGKTHYLKPISTGEFFKVINSLEHLDRMNRMDGKFTDEELLEGYVKLISSVCDTVGKKEILRMEQAQVTALIQLIIDTIAGRTHAEMKKKRNFHVETMSSNDLKPDH